MEFNCLMFIVKANQILCITIIVIFLFLQCAFIYAFMCGETSIRLYSVMCGFLKLQGWFLASVLKYYLCFDCDEQNEDKEFLGDAYKNSFNRKYSISHIQS